MERQSLVSGWNLPLGVVRKMEGGAMGNPGEGGCRSSPGGLTWGEEEPA